MPVLPARAPLPPIRPPPASAANSFDAADTLRMRKASTSSSSVMDQHCSSGYHHQLQQQQHHHHHHLHQNGADVALAMPTLASAAPSPHRTSRWLCLLTTCLAFLLGVGVGVAVPFYVSLPSASSAPSNSSSIGSQGLPTLAPLPLIRPFESAPNASLPTLPVTDAVRRKDWLPHHSNSLTDDDSPASVGAADGRVTFVEPHKVTALEAAVLSQDADLSTAAAAAGGRPRTEPVSGEAVAGIYWSSAVEDLLPAGFDESAAADWQNFTRRESVVRLEEGCGRMQNRLVTFANGTRSCCRYRQNYDQIQGEIFSFYLSRLLALPNLPPSALGLVRPLDDQWNKVRSQLSLAQWAEERPVVFTRFLDHLEPAYIPAEFRGVGPTSGRHLHPSEVSGRTLATERDRLELSTLAQWSDLIVFDYLTANLDRMVNNLYNMQWNPQMMDSPAHNLARDTQTGLLVFLDNESGLLHGYRLLDKYEVYHKSLLDSVCVFRKSTVEALRQLQKRRDVGHRLRALFESRDGPLTDYLPFLPDKSIKTLNHRIDRVLDQVHKCQSLYGTG